MRLPSRKVLVTLVIVAIVAVASTAIFLIAVPLAFAPAARRDFLYNVSVMEAVLPEALGTGKQGYGSSVEIAIPVNQPNLTWFSFTFSWSDQAGSPLADPDVALVFAAPNGTVIFSGPAPRTPTTWNVSLNSLPKGATQRSADADEAIRAVSQGTNATLGTGNWTFTSTVSDILFSRNQIRSAIFLDFGYQYASFELAAEMQGA